MSSNNHVWLWQIFLDDGDDNDQLLLGKNNSTNEDHHEMNDEEIQLYIPIELETN
jgi:hypothetical protein